jgi:aminoglycoside phosphotransferase (APT) family kinase protein
MTDGSPLSEFLTSVLGRTVEVVRLTRVEGGWSRQLHRCALDDGTVLALRGEVTSSVLDTDIAREFAILAALGPAQVPRPRIFGFEAIGDVLGHRFMVMEWVEGTSVNLWRVEARKVFGAGALDGIARSWIRDIAALHGADINPFRVSGIDVDLDADQYVRSEVASWTDRVRRSEYHPGPLVEEACAWLEDTSPGPCPDTSIVHGDLRLGNMVIGADRVRAFLDWEMAGLGDWRADIGYSLMPYHAGKLLAPIGPSWNQLLEPRRFLEEYSASSGREMTDSEVEFFIVLGCIKMIGILCTGIDAFQAGRSRDPRLPWMSIAVPGLVDDICALLDGGLTW